MAPRQETGTQQMLTREQINSRVLGALSLNIDQLAETAGKNAHNMREEWNSITTKVTEFYSRYVNADAARQ